MLSVTDLFEPRLTLEESVQQWQNEMSLETWDHQKRIAKELAHRTARQTKYLDSGPTNIVDFAGERSDVWSPQYRTAYRYYLDTIQQWDQDEMAQAPFKDTLMMLMHQAYQDRHSPRIAYENFESPAADPYLMYGPETVGQNLGDWLADLVPAGEATWAPSRPTPIKSSQVNNAAKKASNSKTREKVLGHAQRAAAASGRKESSRRKSSSTSESRTHKKGPKGTQRAAVASSRQKSSMKTNY